MRLERDHERRFERRDGVARHARAVERVLQVHACLGGPFVGCHGPLVPQDVLSDREK
jgi:hypothetical protein